MIKNILVAVFLALIGIIAIMWAYRGGNLITNNKDTIKVIDKND